MNVLIFEDEKPTANRLINLLKECEHDIKVAGVLGSVKAGISWFRENEIPDLIFQDIILSDGTCFDIFDAVEINVPVIFTTAFSEYALQSFRVNSVDYLLKPYDIKDIERALQRLKKIKGAFHPPEKKLLEEILTRNAFTPKRRFLIKTGDQFRIINSDEVVYLVSEDGVTFATLFDGKRQIVDYSIVELSTQMDPDAFFQINRKIIINVNSVGRISTWFNGRLKIALTPPVNEDIIVSRERVRAFKEWLDR